MGELDTGVIGGTVVFEPEVEAEDGVGVVAEIKPVGAVNVGEPAVAVVGCGRADDEDEDADVVNVVCTAAETGDGGAEAELADGVGGDGGDDTRVDGYAVKPGLCGVDADMLGVELGAVDGEADGEGVVICTAVETSHGSGVDVDTDKPTVEAAEEPAVEAITMPCVAVGASGVAVGASGVAVGASGVERVECVVSGVECGRGVENDGVVGG